MQQRIYRNTFVHFSAAEGHPLPRSQSAPNLSMPSCGQCYDKLNQLQVLSLLLPYVKHRADQQAIGADIAPVVELIEGRLQCDSPIQRLGWRKAEMLDRSLRRMSTSRLMELLFGHPKVDTNFADQVVLLFTRARAVIQTRSAV